MTLHRRHKHMTYQCWEPLLRLPALCNTTQNMRQPSKPLVIIIHFNVDQIISAVDQAAGADNAARLTG